MPPASWPPSPGCRVVAEFLYTGAPGLLQAAHRATAAEAMAALADRRWHEEWLRGAADCLRLLVVLLRERSVWHPMGYSPLQLRRALVHALAAGAPAAPLLPVPPALSSGGRLRRHVAGMRAAAPSAAALPPVCRRAQPQRAG